MLLCVSDGLLLVLGLMLVFALTNFALTVALCFDDAAENGTFLLLAAATMGLELAWGLLTFGAWWPLLWPAALMVRCAFPRLFRPRALWVPPPDPPPMQQGPYR